MWMWVINTRGEKIRAMKMWHLHSGSPLKFTTDYISNVPAVSQLGQSKTFVFICHIKAPKHLLYLITMQLWAYKILVAHPDEGRDKIDNKWVCIKEGK